MSDDKIAVSGTIDFNLKQFYSEYKYTVTPLLSSHYQ